MAMTKFEKSLLFGTVFLVLLFVFLALFSFSAKAQTNGTFKSVRYVNAPPEADIIPVNGTIYYNEDSLKFRAYENGVWKDLITAGGGQDSIHAENTQVIWKDNDGVIRGTDRLLYDSINDNLIFGQGNQNTVAGVNIHNIILGNNSEITSTNGQVNWSFLVGEGNVLNNQDSPIGETINNSAIVGGNLNSIIKAPTTTNIYNAVIVGGNTNTITSDNTGAGAGNNGNSILGGSNNDIIGGQHKSIIGGSSNTINISSNQSAIIGGSSNTINTSVRSVILGGTGITSVSGLNDYVYVPNLLLNNSRLDFDINRNKFFSIVTDDVVFTDNSATATGIEYAANYHSEYTNRSLVDKEYVDNLIPVVPTNYWATDGTSTMTANTIINDGGFDISFTAPNNGILYSADYGANYVDRSLIDFGNANQFYWKTSGTTNIVGITEISNPSHLSTTIANTSGTSPSSAGLRVTTNAWLGYGSPSTSSAIMARSDSTIVIVRSAGKDISFDDLTSGADNWHGIQYEASSNPDITDNVQDNSIISALYVGTIRTLVVPLQLWDMDNDQSHTITAPTGVDASTIREMSAIIFNDAANVTHNLAKVDPTSGLLAGSVSDISDVTGNIRLVRSDGGIFDSPSFSVSPGGNRGYLIIRYEQ